VRRTLSDLALPLLRALPPERAHRAAIRALALMPASAPAPSDPALMVEAFGLKFPNPVGLAAGFDKNAEAVDGALSLGFGFVEVGTLTPKPQAGNPQPRLFRLDEDQAIINRMGFNNCGHAEAFARLARRKRRGIVGVNIGPNKDASDRVADFVAGVTAFAEVADYLTINISSPNTPGLRDLQQGEALDALIARVIDAREAGPKRPPLLVKIAPDVTLPELDAIVAVARKRRVDGMIVSNTTLARPASLRGGHAKEAGGLSGRPLFEASTALLGETFRRVERQFPLIGVGGIEDADTAMAKIEAGASLVQIYTGFVLRGPRVIDSILDGLAARVRARGAASIGALVGTAAR
jgi:dihydroorotate dehydrogenase